MLEETERQNGIRWSWNVYPNSRVESQRMVVPLACLYTPKKEIPDLPALPYEPIPCRGCSAKLNPYCRVDLATKSWHCPFCMTRNQFPPHYSSISETQLPAELFPNYTTIEYTLMSPPQPPVIIFCIDLCMPENELAAVKDSILQSVNLIPNYYLVGLVTFGTYINVHELAYTDCFKSYCFRGNTEFTAEKLQETLQLLSSPAHGLATPNRFIQPVSACEVTLSSILEELSPDPWPVKHNNRAHRCTGAALSLSLNLLELTCVGSGGRVMLFIGGPCTSGPGAVVGIPFTEQMRSYNDINKGRAQYLTKATKFYDALAAKAIFNSHCVDVFSASFDQTGLLELRDCVINTGGYLYTTEEFDSECFRKTMERVFAQNANYESLMAFNGYLEVQTSSEWKVSGAIGPCVSARKSSSSVGETEVGEGKTCAWRINGLSPDTTIGMYFEVVNQHNQPMPPDAQRFIQLCTTYHHSSGSRRLRVTTLAYRWGTTDAMLDLVSGFDQYAAIALMARLAVDKTKNEQTLDILRWLDRNLIKLMARVAEYEKDAPQTFRLSPMFLLFPQFMFHLRRSPFLQVFNHSPDETTFNRSVLLRENARNTAIMIQPTLRKFSFKGPPESVPLDAASIEHDAILLLDTYFHVVVFHGETIAGWFKDKLQERPEYEHFRRLLKHPEEEGRKLLEARFPYPRFVTCAQGTSQARLLTSKLNPSITHKQVGGVQPGAGEVIMTDDVALQVFMERLVDLAVRQ